MLSPGHTYGLVMISVTKWCLQGEMPPAMRLEFLGHLEKQADGTLTPAVIAMVEPIDDKGMELYREAMKLGYGPSSPCAFDVLYKKFDVFAALNPSLRRAHDAASSPWSKSA